DRHLSLPSECAAVELHPVAIDPDVSLAVERRLFDSARAAAAAAQDDEFRWYALVGARRRNIANSIVAADRIGGRHPERNAQILAHVALMAAAPRRCAAGTIPPRNGCRPRAPQPYSKSSRGRCNRPTALGSHRPD